MNESLNIDFDEALNNLSGIFFWHEDLNEARTEIHFSEGAFNVTGYNGKEIKELERGWESLIFKDDLSDFIDKIHYYLDRWDESCNIIDNAYEDFSENHTWDRRGADIVKAFEDLI